MLMTILFPIFSLIGIGVLLRRTGYMEATGFQGLSDIVFLLGMPALMFSAIAKAPSLDIIHVAGIYFAACLIIFVGMVMALQVLGKPLPHGSMMGLNACFGNCGMMGIPIVAAALGQDALAPLLAIITLHSAILLTLATVLIEFGSGTGNGLVSSIRTSLVRALKNPIVLSVLAGTLWRMTGLIMPAPVQGLLQLLSGIAIPLALVCIGATLPPLKLSSLHADAVVASALKLVGLPLLVWGLGSLAHLPHQVLIVAIITAAMPTGANAFMLARRAGHLADTSATTVLMTTALSAVTITVILGVLL